MDCTPLGSPDHGVSQARTLEWVAISSSTNPFDLPICHLIFPSQGSNLHLLHWQVYSLIMLTCKSFSHFFVIKTFYWHLIYNVVFLVYSTVNQLYIDICLFFFRFFPPFYPPTLKGLMMLGVS